MPHAAGSYNNNDLAYLHMSRTVFGYSTIPPPPQLVELKNGETYNGHLASCDHWMNLNLREVILTSRVMPRSRSLPFVLHAAPFGMGTGGEPWCDLLVCFPTWQRC